MPEVKFLLCLCILVDGLTLIEWNGLFIEVNELFNELNELFGVFCIVWLIFCANKFFPSDGLFVITNGLVFPLLILKGLQLVELIVWLNGLGLVWFCMKGLEI